MPRPPPFPAAAFTPPDHPAARRRPCPGRLGQHRPVLRRRPARPLLVRLRRRRPRHTRLHAGPRASPPQPDPPACRPAEPAPAPRHALQLRHRTRNPPVTQHDTPSQVVSPGSRSAVAARPARRRHRHTSVTPSGTHEVYGLHLTGVSGAGLLPAPTADAARPRVVIRHARQDPEPGCMRAVLDLPGRRQLLFSRGEGTATFTGPRPRRRTGAPPPGRRSIVFSRWPRGLPRRAFVFGSLAWAVVGGREAGKSSLLAALAARDLPVLADDLVISDSHQAFCGPRTIDLRQLAPGATAPVTPGPGRQPPPAD